MQVLRLALKPYVPDFTTAFEHFCIHPGGKAVIEEVSKQLKLRPEQSLPMLVPFERYGNTSSSSTWCAPNPTRLPRSYGEVVRKV